jgi:hypothetical protein
MFRRLGVVVLIYNSYYLKGRRKIKSWSPVSQTKQNKRIVDIAQYTVSF